MNLLHFLALIPAIVLYGLWTWYSWSKIKTEDFIAKVAKETSLIFWCVINGIGIIVVSLILATWGLSK